MYVITYTKTAYNLSKEDFIMTEDLIKQDESRKNEIIKQATSLDFYTAIPTNELALKGRTKIPLTEISTMGVAFQPLVSGIQEIITGGEAVSGLYMVTVPKGAQLVRFKDGRGLMGSITKGNNAVGGGQAVLNKLGFTPEMAADMAMAAALFGIERKINQIQKSQDELMEFVEEKDRYMLKGSLYFLMDMLSNFKFNYGNEKYINTNHNKVLDVKESAEQSILLYSELIKKRVEDTSLLHIDSSVKEKLKKLQGYFKSYQIALYNYAFSSFLDVVLLGNFSKDFLDAIIDKIDKYSFEYREIYTLAYTKIEEFNDSSVGTLFLKGVAKSSSFVGENVGKVKKLDKIGDKLNSAGKIFEQINDEKKDDILNKVISNKTNYAFPFVNAIRYISNIYNNELKIVVSEDSVYVDEEVV